MASRTEDVTKSRRKAQSEGRQRLTAMLSAEGSAEYSRLRERYSSERALIEAALAALAAKNDLTQEQVIDWIKRNTGATE